MKPADKYNLTAKILPIDLRAARIVVFMNTGSHLFVERAIGHLKNSWIRIRDGGKG